MFVVAMPPQAPPVVLDYNTAYSQACKSKSFMITFFKPVPVGSKVPGAILTWMEPQSGFSHNQVSISGPWKQQEQVVYEVLQSPTMQQIKTALAKVKQTYQSSRVILPKVESSKDARPGDDSNQTSRSARGHTHTCYHCQITWDHFENPTHNCQNCGRPQYVIDSPSKMVTITKRKQ